MFRTLLVLTLILIIPPVYGADGACDYYQRFPLAGHPVAVVELHPSDKNFQVMKELENLKLILLEPGICKSKIPEKGWYQGRVFVFRSRSASFSHGNIIEIEAGRFK
jgi:hypothetical protein